MFDMTKQLGLFCAAALALASGCAQDATDPAESDSNVNLGDGHAGSGGGAPSSPGATGNSGGGGAPAPSGSSGSMASNGSTGGTPASDAGATPGEEPGGHDGMRDVLLVGNSVAGTVSFIDAETLENLGSVDVIPDFDEVMQLIEQDLVRSIAYPIVTQAQLLHHFEPASGERFVDDVFVSPDGTVLYVSRSNLGDVAAFDLTEPDHPLLWRSFVDSPKADHAAISPDGNELVVSATGTTRTANVFDAHTGQKIGSFPTGAYPHQNDYTPDGKFIYNSSIGDVRYNGVSYQNNLLKGDRWLVKVDAETLQIVDTWVFEFGIRPNVIAEDETVLYTQLSYFNGVVKYDLVAKKEIARIEEPVSDFVMETYATYDEYPHDSAHHGLALSKDGETLCDCGTIGNTVTLISADTMGVEKRLDVGMMPYWATTSSDGRYCFVTLSGDDAISVIDYERKEEVAVVPVGFFPQRSRMGHVPNTVIEQLRPIDG